MRILIPGGSGQVGRILARSLQASGHSVTVLSRKTQTEKWPVVIWDGRSPGAWVKQLDGCDVVINLTGRSVNCRYNRANRESILGSRVQSTQLLNSVIGSMAHPPRVWLNAATATIYRHSLDREMDEFTGELGGGEPGAPETWNFSINVAKQWEKAFFSTAAPNTRKVALRSAMTLSPDHGGVFDVLLGLVRHGLGGAQGSGQQFISWIHETDFVRAIEMLMARDDMDGIVNLASPNPIPNRDFMAILKSAWGTRIGLPVFPWMVEVGAFFMRTESELILKSRRVVPGRLLAEGFQFTFSKWEAAARDLVSHWKAAN